MAKSERGKANEQQGARSVLGIFRKAGVSRSQLAADARHKAKAPKRGGQS